MKPKERPRTQYGSVRWWAIVAALALGYLIALPYAIGWSAMLTPVPSVAFSPFLSRGASAMLASSAAHWLAVLACAVPVALAIHRCLSEGRGLASLVVAVPPTALLWMNVYTIDGTLGSHAVLYAFDSLKLFLTPWLVLQAFAWLQRAPAPAADPADP